MVGCPNVIAERGKFLGVRKTFFAKTVQSPYCVLFFHSSCNVFLAKRPFDGLAVLGAEVATQQTFTRQVNFRELLLGVV